MRWDPVKIKQGKKDRAKTELKSTIKSAMESGLLFDDLMLIVTEAINETIEEMRIVAEEAM